MLPLLWLRWKQVQGNANFWLRLVDYDTTDRDIMNRAYGWYLAGFMLWWTAAMWAIAAGFIGQIGSAITPAARQSTLALVPTAIFVGQALLLMWKLHSSPYKLSSPDIAYVAGSPIQRAFPITLGFFGDLALPLALSTIIASFVAVALNLRVGPIGAIVSALQAVGGIIPIMALVWAVAWLAGLVRMVIPGARHWSALWLAPVLLLPLPFVASGLIGWPGTAFASILAGQVNDLSAIGPVALAALAAIVLMSLVGMRVNMIDVADESLIHARLKEIGNLRFIAPKIYNQAKSQYQSASRRPRFHLPDAQGVAMLVTRSALVTIRNPLELVKLLIAVALIQGGLAMLAYPIPALLIVVWLWAVAVAPTSSLIRVFNADTDDPSLRQFLPVDSLRLLLADAGLPMALVIVVSAALWLAQPVGVATAIVGLALIGVLAFLLVLCRGGSLLKLASMSGHVSYGVLAVVCLGLTLGAGLLFGGMLASILVGGLVIAVLASLIKAA